MVAGVSAMTLAGGLSTQAQAAACAANSTTIAVGASCTGTMNWTLSAGSVINNGTITGGTYGVSVTATGRTINTLTNNGTISASSSGVQATNSGAIGHLINNGLIQSTSIGVAALSNGTIGTITNTGTISGGIVNRTIPVNLVFIGGSGSTFGTLTGPAIRSIESTIAGVTFASGNMVLDINVNTSLAQTMMNSGASLKLINNRTLTGNYSQTGGSLMFAASAPTVFPKFTVTGTASLTGGNIVLIPTGAAGASAGTYTIVSAAGGVTNTVNATATGYTAVVSVAGTNLLITLTQFIPPVVPVVPGDSGSPGTSPPASGSASSGSNWTVKAATAGGQAVPVGPVLDALAGNPNFQGLLAALAALPAPAQNIALQQLGTPTLAPQSLTSGATFLLSTSAIGQRQSALLAGQPGGKAAGSAPDGSGAWVQVLGNRASLNGSATSTGFHASSHGITVGGDTSLGEDFVGGGAISWLSNRLTGEGSSTGNRSDVDSYQLATYGVWRPNGGPAHFNGLLSVGRNDYDQARDINFLASTATAKYHGWQAQLKIGAGYDIPLDSGMTVTPLASLQATRIQNASYQESGAGVANLSVAQQKFNSVESELGAKLSATTDTGWGRLTGEVQAGWVHSFTNNAVATTATMGGVSFVTSTDRLAKDGAHVVLRATLRRAGGLSYAMEYDGYTRSGFRSNTALVKLRYDF